jgi:hypothetical protein
MALAERLRLDCKGGSAASTVLRRPDLPEASPARLARAAAADQNRVASDIFGGVPLAELPFVVALALHLLSLTSRTFRLNNANFYPQPYRQKCSNYPTAWA